jgi:hypothetical protein
MARRLAPQRTALLALLLACALAGASAGCQCTKGEPSSYTTALKTSGKKAFWEPARFPLHNATAEYDFVVSLGEGGKGHVSVPWPLGWGSALPPFATQRPDTSSQ